MDKNESRIFSIESDDFIKIGNRLLLYDPNIDDVKEWEITDIGMSYPVLLRNNSNSRHYRKISIRMARVEITPVLEEQDENN